MTEIIIFGIMVIIVTIIAFCYALGGVGLVAVICQIVITKIKDKRKDDRYVVPK